MKELSLGAIQQRWRDQKDLQRNVCVEAKVLSFDCGKFDVLKQGPKNILSCFSCCSRSSIADICTNGFTTVPMCFTIQAKRFCWSFNKMSKVCRCIPRCFRKCSFVGVVSLKPRLSGLGMSTDVVCEPGASVFYSVQSCDT